VLSFDFCAPLIVYKLTYGSHMKSFVS